MSGSVCFILILDAFIFVHSFFRFLKLTCSLTALKSVCPPFLMLFSFSSKTICWKSTNQNPTFSKSEQLMIYKKNLNPYKKIYQKHLKFLALLNKKNKFHLIILWWNRCWLCFIIFFDVFYVLWPNLVQIQVRKAVSGVFLTRLDIPMQVWHMVDAKGF